MSGVQKFIHRIDSISEWSGRIFAWLSLPMVVFMAYDVIMRYLFQAPTKWAYEMTWMQYGALFMLGGAYGLKYKLHVRVDIIYVRWSKRTQAIFDFLDLSVYLFPRVLYPDQAQLDLRLLFLGGLGDLLHQLLAAAGLPHQDRHVPRPDSFCSAGDRGIHPPGDLCF